MPRTDSPRGPRHADKVVRTASYLGGSPCFFVSTAEVLRFVLAIEQAHVNAVTMIETAGDPLARLVLHPFTELLVHLRNVESLRRLRRIAEDRTSR
jgi:hypothetical protein